jgi:hypothetical protein
MLTNTEHTLVYLKGLKSLLNDIHNGRSNHEKANILFLINGYIFILERGDNLKKEKVDLIVLRAKDFIRREHS